MLAVFAWVGGNCHFFTISVCVGAAPKLSKCRFVTISASLNNAKRYDAISGEGE